MKLEINLLFENLALLNANEKKFLCILSEIILGYSQASITIWLKFCNTLSCTPIVPSPSHLNNLSSLNTHSTPQTLSHLSSSTIPSTSHKPQPAKQNPNPHFPIPPPPHQSSMIQSTARSIMKSRPQIAIHWCSNDFHTSRKGEGGGGGEYRYHSIKSRRYLQARR